MYQIIFFICAALFGRFVTEYNQLEEALQRDEEVKCEWHLRIRELEDTVWNITDTRRCEAEQERYAIMTSGWIEDRWGWELAGWKTFHQR